jgi:hypothetical protein
MSQVWEEDTLMQVDLSGSQSSFLYDKVQNVMIGLAVIHVCFVIVSACLVYRVYKLVKFRDIPILLSIFTVFCSLLSKRVKIKIFIAMLAWVILFFFFIHADKTSFLKKTNIMRLVNFTATMFFGIALVFDLYKW